MCARYGPARLGGAAVELDIPGGTLVWGNEDLTDTDIEALFGQGMV